MLDYGADAELWGGIGGQGTALMLAVRGSHPQVVALLLKRGAAVNNPGHDYSTPLDMVKFLSPASSPGGIARRAKVLALLQKAGARGYWDCLTLGDGKPPGKGRKSKGRKSKGRKRR